MKTKNQKSFKKTLIKIFILIVIIGLVLTILEKTHITNFTSQPQASNKITSKTIDYNSPTTEQKQAGEDIKKSNNNQQTTTFSALITAANVNGNVVQIRAGIYGVVSGSGTCGLTLTNANDTITKTSATYALPSSSTCQGFDVNRSELSPGTWNISLTVTVGSETANATGEVTLE